MNRVVIKRDRVVKKKWIYGYVGMFLLCLAGTPLSSFAQGVGVIKGQVIDSTTHEPVFGVNIFITDLQTGDATDLEGHYSVSNVPAGTYRVQFSYVSYKTKVVEVSVTSGKVTSVNVALVPDYVVGEDVEVLAQAAGQAEAIRKQLKSNTIVDVVSSDRISELPDQNAAASVGRLPGVSVVRNAGEAQKVVIRGLSPRFNSITVNGVRLPGTDPNNRSVDLSLIPPDILSGIQVYKALTPDMDADAIGGTVNLVIKKAPDNPVTNIKLQGGYNGLKNDFGQYKGSLDFARRFLNDKLGLIVTGSIQKANRSSEAYEGTYVYESGITLANLNLVDRLETRYRYGLGVTLDYQLKNSSFFMNNFMGRTDRDELRRRKRYRVNNTRVEYDLRDRDLFSVVYSNSLGGDHNLGALSIDWLVSNAYSLYKQPYANYARFEELGAYDPIPPKDATIFEVPGYARNNLGSTYFQYGTFDPQRGTDRDFSAEVNFKVPYEMSHNLGGFFKFGGKFRGKKKVKNADEYLTPFGRVSQIGREHPEDFTLYNDTHIAISNFIDGTIGTDFMNGTFDFGPRLNADRIDRFHSTYESAYERNRSIDLQDYTAREDIYAAYVMTELHIGEKLVFVPGVRYEYTANNYDGKFGNLYGDLGEKGMMTDTTGGQNYGEFMPMVNLKYTVTDNVNIRFAVTKTLNRPDYYNLVPYQQINDAEQTIAEGNPDLKYATSWNYDVFLSFFKSELGYLSVGTYYKKIKGIDYTYTRRLLEGPYSGFIKTSPVNSGITDVYGIETAVQTDLRFLPKPLNGLIFSGNIALIKSETKYPFLYDTGVRSTEPPYESIYIDTTRTGSMVGQPNVVGGFSLGYEKGGFSARVSLSYQAQILEQVGNTVESDGQLVSQDYGSDSFAFWDFSLNQKIPWVRGLTLFMDLNNFTGETDRTIYAESLPSRKERFGWTGDLGIRYQL